MEIARHVRVLTTEPGRRERSRTSAATVATTTTAASPLATRV
jgi:hypothetical protein